MKVRRYGSRRRGCRVKRRGYDGSRESWQYIYIGMERSGMERSIERRGDEFELVAKQ